MQLVPEVQSSSVLQPVAYKHSGALGNVGIIVEDFVGGTNTTAVVGMVLSRAYTQSVCKKQMLLAHCAEGLQH